MSNPQFQQNSDSTTHGNNEEPNSVNGSILQADSEQEYSEQEISVQVSNESGDSGYNDDESNFIPPRPPRPNLIRYEFCSECQSTLETEYLNGRVISIRCLCPRHN